MFEHGKMDQMLRKSLADQPVPRLSPDFDRRVLSQVRPRRVEKRALVVLAIYAVLAAITSVAVMRSQSVGWMLIAISVVAPLCVAAMVVQRKA